MVKSYKKMLIISMAVAAGLVLGMALPQEADSKIITNVPADISGDALKAVVIDDFESAVAGDKGWAVQSTPKKYTNPALSEKKLKRKNPVPELEAKIVNGSPNDLSVEEWSLTGLGKKKEKILGVRFKFRYPGINTIHILPPPEVDWKEKKPVYTYNPSTGKDEQERGLQLPGRAKAISLWVHGRGNPYFLDIWVKDYTGNTHVLKCGDVNFIGWRPVKVKIPSFIPQSVESYPQTRVSKITRIVLRANPNSTASAMTERTFFFFDQIKVLTDTYEVNYDGQELHKAFTGDKKTSGGATK